VFKDAGETNNDFAKRRILADERSKAGYRELMRAYEDMFGEGLLVVQNAADYRADGGKIGGGKGANRRWSCWRRYGRASTTSN